MVMTYFMLLFASVVWGFQPVPIKWILTEWSPVTISAVRYMIISAVMALIVYPREKGHFLPKGIALVWLACMGVTGILLNNVLQFTGLRETTVINCTLISATTPAVTALMAVFIIRERLNLFSWLGIFISFCGVLVVVSNGSWEMIRSIDFHRGDVYCILSQVCWAAYSFFGLKLMRKKSVLWVTLWAGFFGGLMSLTYGLVTNDFHVPLLSPVPLASFLYMLIFGGLLSGYFYNVGVKKAGPSLAAIFMNIMPVVGMISGYIILNEELGIIRIAGAGAIFVGVYLTTHGHELAAKVGR